MINHMKSLFGIAFFFFFIFTLREVNAQNINTDKFQYLSPVPGSKLNTIETNIIIRYGDAFDNYNIGNSLVVTGSKSGYHTGKVILAEDNKTLIFKPDTQFSDGEVVTVEFNPNLKTVLNKQVPDLKYSFETSKINLNKMIKSNPDKYSSLLSSGFETVKNTSLLKSNISQNLFNQKTYTIQKDSLPKDFPVITVNTINNPAPGKIFLTPYLRRNGSAANYIIIIDNYGVPVFYRKMASGRALDFEKQAPNVLTYNNSNYFFVMDSSYNIVDSLYMQNGYIPDSHDCLLLDNEHSIMIGYDYQIVGMDTVVAGGNANATVIGLIIQELDENKNLLFQWRSWDHFNITDATYDISLTNVQIDYVHGNAIEIDNDGNILLSSRNMDEITKINRETGEIIWRLGGIYCKNNQFTFIDDPTGFSHQHDVRRIANGDLTIFDNGNLHSPSYSRAVEYKLDETNKTAALVWEYKNNPATFSQATGNNRILDNQNRIICWGWTSSPPAVSEVTPGGTVSLSISLSSTFVNYRGVKYNWKTNLFVTNPDTLSFEYTAVGDSSIKLIDIKNNSANEIEINGVLNSDSSFYVNTLLPVIIPALDTKTISVVFKPRAMKEYSDNLYLQWNKETERISRKVYLRSNNLSSVGDSGPERSYLLSQNYPNPFNPVTTISYNLPVAGNVSLKIYDILGKEIADLVNRELPAGRYSVKWDASKFVSGLYFYRIQAANFIQTKKMILLK